MKAIVPIVVALVLVGCAHTPFTGMAVERCVREAMAAGWEPVPYGAPGERRYIPPEIAQRIRFGSSETPEDEAQIREKLEDMVRSGHGRSDIEVALSTRPWLVRAAQACDAALISGAVAAAGYGLSRLDIGGDSGDKDNRVIRVDAREGGVVVVDSRAGESIVVGGGKEMPAEEEKETEQAAP